MGKKLLVLIIIAGLFTAIPASAALNFFTQTRDSDGYVALGRVASGYVDAQVLTANVAVSHTIPAGATKVMFSSTGNIYVKFGGTAAIPTGAVTNGSASLLNPQLVTLDGSTTIGIISPTDGVVTLEFFK